MTAAVTSAERDAPTPAAEGPTAPNGPDFDQIEQLTEAVRGLLVQAKVRHRQMEQHSDHGRLSVLYTLYRLGPARASALAKEVHLDLSTVSRHIRSLEDEGQIAKTADPDDKRAFQVELTEQGAGFVREYMTKRVEQLHAALGLWTAQDVRLLTDLLHRLVRDTEGTFK